MGAPVIPVVLQGPAIAKWNGQSFYTKEGINKSLKREMFDLSNDHRGKWDSRLKSQKSEFSLTPVGQFQGTDLGKYFPYSIADIGTSIFDKAAELIIHTKAGQKITYKRAAMMKLPQLRLSAGETLFGDVGFVAIGRRDVEATDAAAWKEISAEAFADASYDESQIITDIYKAAYGLAPYDEIGSADGFRIDITMGLKEMMFDANGIVDIVLDSLSAGASFAPSNLTEAELDTLLALQDDDALLPGQSPSKPDQDLVITSDSFEATLYKAGPQDAEYIYTTGQHRFKGVTWMNRQTSTAGVANPLWKFEVL